MGAIRMFQASTANKVLGGFAATGLVKKEPEPEEETPKKQATRSLSRRFRAKTGLKPMFFPSFSTCFERFCIGFP